MPKFSQDEDHVYYIRRLLLEIGLEKAALNEDGDDIYFRNISQNHPFFSVNHDHLIVFSSEEDSINIFHN